VDFVDPEGRAVPGKDQEPTPGDDVLEEAVAEEDEPFRTAADTANVGEDVGISEDEIDLPLLIDIALIGADVVSGILTVADIIAAGPTGEGIILAAGVQAGKAKLKKAAIKKAVGGKAAGGVKNLSTKQLKKAGVDAEAAKKALVGKRDAGKFNLGIDSKSGEVILTPVKKGSGPNVPTGLTLDGLKGL